MARHATPAEGHSRARTMVICLGNEHRGDDALGPRVALRLGERVGGAPVVAHRGNELDLLDLWDGCKNVVLVDALAVAGEAGTVVRFDLARRSVPVDLGAASTHALGPGGVIEVARALGRLPARVELVGVAAGTFAIGAPMTTAVEDRLDEVVEEVRRIVESCGGQDDTAAPTPGASSTEAG
jgi:hydrogenase maturation protease